VIEDFAEPLQNEIIVVKQMFDGFINTNHMEVLDAHDIKGALFAGLETLVCILFTATSYLRGIVPIVVSDACADEPMRHEATLRTYRDLCFKTVTTIQVRDEWQSVECLVEQFVK
jgi:isochorismate hydrolase